MESTQASLLLGDEMKYFPLLSFSREPTEMSLWEDITSLYAFVTEAEIGYEVEGKEKHFISIIHSW